MATVAWVQALAWDLCMLQMWKKKKKKERKKEKKELEGREIEKNEIVSRTESYVFILKGFTVCSRK